jgi:hypothetical protein
LPGKESCFSSSLLKNGSKIFFFEKLAGLPKFFSLNASRYQKNEIKNKSKKKKEKKKEKS